MNNNNNNLCALILAGGQGSRFWPKSTPETPKQFLNLIDDKTMLQLTVDRVIDFIPLERIFVLVSPRHKDIVLKQIKGISEKNIIIQPEIMNTGPCILMASLYIKDICGNSNLVVMPSDHLIKGNDKFRKIMEVANNFCTNNLESIITIGILPTRPETGFGYIKKSDNILLVEGREVIEIEKFVEKPCLNKALDYLNNGHYFWNSGIFLFNINHILDTYKSNLPTTYDVLSKLPNANDDDYLIELINNYKKCEAISFDVAVMEKTNNNYVIPSDFVWDDIGTWVALERYTFKDIDNNVTSGDVKYVNSLNNIVYGNDKKIILIGVNNIFCVDADDVLMIGNKEEIKNIYEYQNMLDEEFGGKNETVSSGSNF